MFCLNDLIKSNNLRIIFYVCLRISEMIDQFEDLESFI